MCESVEIHQVGIRQIAIIGGTAPQVHSQQDGIDGGAGLSPLWSPEPVEIGIGFRPGEIGEASVAELGSLSQGLITGEGSPAQQRAAAGQGGMSLGLDSEQVDLEEAFNHFLDERMEILALKR